MNRFAGNRTKHIFDDQGAASASTLIPIDYGSAGVMPVKYHRADSPGGGSRSRPCNFGNVTRS